MTFEKYMYENHRLLTSIIKFYYPKYKCPCLDKLDLVTIVYNRKDNIYV